jgi:hypothetical protein
MKVWLIQFNSLDSSIAALDSTTTCAVDSMPYYEFDGKPAGNYMVKAKLIYGTIPGTSGYIPTYSLSTPHWDSAATVVHATASDSLPITMVYGIVPPGPGFIAGYVISGAGRGTTGDIPAVDMLVYLKDASGHVLTYTYTDTRGYYSFPSLANGNYIIYPEAYDFVTTPSSLLTLTAAAEYDTIVNFKQHNTYHTITPYLISTGASPLPSVSGLNVFPNPSSGLLTIDWTNQAAGNADIIITDIMGREAFKSVLNINASTGRSTLDLSGLKNGIYLMTIKSGTIYYSGKLMIQE